MEKPTHVPMTYVLVVVLNRSNDKLIHEINI